ncbi:MAG: PAS domain-containing protein [Xanthobacteraceae bacterium]|nr:PAS domain-containing protein [Xanthobacteraceae bacterium]
MQRFIEQQNRAHYRKLLAVETDPRLIKVLEGLLRSTERTLAILEASATGVRSDAQLVRDRYLPRATPKAISHFQREFEATDRPWLLVDPGPGLHIVDINDTYATATLTARSKVAGEKLFDIFPDNPDDPAANGASMLFRSLKTVSESGQPHEMAVQRYDVRDATGAFVARFWQPRNMPILDDGGRLLFILHHVEDVTSRFAAAAASAA